LLTLPASPLVGSFCTGYGGLDKAVCEAVGGELAWVADIDPDASTLLRLRYPSQPNLGDVRGLDWPRLGSLSQVSVICAGFPCQDVSVAGRHAGIAPGTRSGIWSYIAWQVSLLRPALVVVENVEGLLRARAHSNVEPCAWCLGDPSAIALRACGAVLGDLSRLGYDAEWATVSADEVGSCHRRRRVVITAWPADSAGG
jgi:DNA (cytosine-5)-methyltransferase 1